MQLFDGMKKIIAGAFSAKVTPPEEGPPREELVSIEDKVFQDQVIAEVEEKFEYSQQERIPWELQWRLNLNYLLGNQYCDIDPVSNEIIDIDKLYWYQERNTYNHIAPTVETRLAKLARVRPSMRARPATTDFNDTATAKVTTAVIKATQRKLNQPDAIQAASNWSETCGTSFYKSSWDAGAGRILAYIEHQPFAEGDIAGYVCPPFEIFPESSYADDVQSLRWLIHAKYYHEDDVEELWGRRLKGEDASVFTLGSTTIGTGQLGMNATMPTILQATKTHQVLVKEYYERPSKAYPDGRLVIIANGELLYYGSLPYTNLEDKRRGFPFDRQVCISNPGCFWGTSIIERLIPVQRAYNAVKNRKQEFLNAIALGITDVEDGAYDMDDLLRDGLAPGKILVRAPGKDRAQPLDFGRMSLAEFDKEEDKLVNEFILISGVSELSRNSAAPTGAGSGVALEVLREQDETRLSLTAENIRKANLSLAQKWVRMYRQLVVGPRLDRLVGDSGEVLIRQWSKNDLTTDDLVFETENELIDTPAQRKQTVLDLLQTPLLIDPATGVINKRTRNKLLEMLQLGNWEGADDITELQIRRAQRENMYLEENVPPEVREYDDDALHIEVHDMYRLSGDYELLRQNNPNMAMAIDQHVKLHQASMRFKMFDSQQDAALRGMIGGDEQQKQQQPGGGVVQ